MKQYMKVKKIIEQLSINFNNNKIIECIVNSKFEVLKSNRIYKDEKKNKELLY